MRNEYQRTESLYEIVFRDRNREYGSYQIHKRYLRTLVISVLWGVAIFLVMAGVPMIYYSLHNPGGLTESGPVYVVDYLPIEPPPEDLDELAHALSKPKEETFQAPVVSDSITPMKEITPPEKLLENQQEENEDSLPVGNGGVQGGTGTADLAGVATIIDVYPRYPGGDEARLNFLRKNVRYPEIALKSKIQGVVIVVFIIETDGSISNVRIEKGIGGGCDEEALRVAQLMPRWDPGKRQAKPVRVMVRMPIIFRIPGKSS